MDIVAPKYHWLVALNPLAGLIQGYRSSLLGQPWDLPMLGVSSVGTLVALFAGMRLFKSMERRLADLA
jgi:lipopolysaccharide transport system permease protein